MQNAPDGTNRFSRREMLRRSGMGLGTLGLATLLADESAAATGRSLHDPMAPRAPHFAPKAKRVIHIFLNGGGSHMDMYDPKPELARQNGKQLPGELAKINSGRAFGSPFQFAKHGECGTEISEICPQVAKHVDDICFIRSMHTSTAEHEGALMMMNSGALMTQTTPTLGAWSVYGLGTENQNLPAYVVLCPANGGMPIKGPENWRSAFLPPIYQGTFVDTFYPDTVETMVRHVRNGFVGKRQQRRQVDVLQELNRRHLEVRGGDAALESRIQSYEMAFRMQTSASDAFDLSNETKETRASYGESLHGKQMLIARRLLERDVRFVQVWHGAGQPWDLHTNLTPRIRRVSAEMDQPIAALLSDLKQRGMLEDTLVYWCGEFGRMPTEEFLGKSKQRGRSHNPEAFTVAMAGAGIRGGMTYGATDEFGHKAVEKRVHVHDLHATILHQLGFDHRKLTYRHAGRDFRLTDVGGNVVRDILA